MGEVVEENMESFLVHWDVGAGVVQGIHQQALILVDLHQDCPPVQSKCLHSLGALRTKNSYHLLGELL